MEVRMKTQLVQDWMTRDPVTINPRTTLPEASRLMKARSIRHLPVMDDGRLVGIVTWGDIREASASDSTTLSIYELNALLDSLYVSFFMTHQPITVTPDVGVARAAQIMLENKIGCLPVVDGGRLVGIITDSDIFRVVMLGQAA
jgi:CBS domain-containing protein